MVYLYSHHPIRHIVSPNFTLNFTFMAEINLQAAIDNKKCYNCGKKFRTPADLLKHKNRKTPCLIREIAPDQINNPNRCIFCNKILSKKEHLTRHLGVCKIKNGGMDMLADKVIYEREIQLMKEKDRQKDEKIKNMEEKFKIMSKKIDALETALIPTGGDATKNTNTNITNYNINITVNNYTKPSLEGITITPEELSNATKLSKFLLQKLYFNPDLPQNHCLYLQNKKDKTLIVNDGGNWTTVIGDNVAEVITNLSNTLYIRGSDIVNGKNGPYKGVDAEYMALPGADQKKIYDFNRTRDILSNDDAYEVFLGGRDVVLGTIRAAGCKMV